MKTESSLARRYHWHSKNLRSFVEEPHTAIEGENQGLILNLTDKNASASRAGIVELARESPAQTITEFRKLVMPLRHDVREKDVDLKRLGSALALSSSLQVQDFETFLLLEGVGPRTVQSLALVSEVIHGTPTRFSDPARFSFAHGGKDGHPFPVPTKVYDESIVMLEKTIRRAKMGIYDKQAALKKLSQLVKNMEKDFKAEGDLQKLIEHEKLNSWKYGGRTVFGKSKPVPVQTHLF